MKHLFIINPAAGSRDRTEHYRKEIARVCDPKGLDYRIHVSAAPGDCRTAAIAAAQTGEEYRIYACGGDGTLNEVVSGVAGYPNAAVTAYQGGSGNDFIKIFDEPDAFKDLERLLDCKEVDLDLIKCNDDYCLNICSVGLDARIGTDVSNYKRLPLLTGFRAYAVSTLFNVIKGISEHYVVKIGDETVDARQTMICVCNGRWYGGSFNPCPDAEPDDGLLDILLVKPVNLLQVAMVIGKYQKGQYANYPHLLRHFRSDHVKITCFEDSVVNLDGESLRTQEVTFAVSSHKLRFFYPAGLQYRCAVSNSEEIGVI